MNGEWNLIQYFIEYEAAKMWQFRFFIDYEWTDQRVIWKEHCVLVNDHNLNDKNMAWNWLKDTFQVEDMEYNIAENFRLVDAEFIGNVKQS